MTDLCVLRNWPWDVLIALFVFYVLYKRIDSFPAPLEIVDNPKREKIEVGSLFSLSFVLMGLEWADALPSHKNEIFLSSRIFVIPVLLFIFIIAINHRTLREVGLVGFSSESLISALFLVLFAAIWSFSPLILSCDVLLEPWKNQLFGLFNPAFIEEWEFRAVYQTKLERTCGQQKAWMYGGILFGLFHVPKFLNGWVSVDRGLLPLVLLLQYLIIKLTLPIVMGCVFGVVFTKTRSIWPCVVAHYLYDFIPTWICLLLH